ARRGKRDQQPINGLLPGAGVMADRGCRVGPDRPDSPGAVHDGNRVPPLSWLQGAEHRQGRLVRVRGVWGGSAAGGELLSRALCPTVGSAVAGVSLEEDSMRDPWGVQRNE